MKKFICLMAAATVMSTAGITGAYAAQFSDMPDNWTTGALERAVENGLLNGSDGKIMPDDNITRAQMAAIMVRAFGADEEADISSFSDVSPDKWYYSEFAKAVYMKAFEGTDDGKLNPESNITFEECFTVVSRVMDLRENNPEKLEEFSDSEKIADWAKTYMVSVVGNGYWNGIDNNKKLTPKSYITRSQFAVLMDNLITTYVSEPGIYTEFEPGNILVRSEGVTIDGLTTEDMIIVGDGVHGTTNITNVDSSNLIVGRGGNLFVTGKINNISAIVSGVNLDISQISERTGKVKVLDGTNVNLGSINAFPG